MALSASRLKNALKARYEALTAGGAQPTMDACMLALAEELVAEITGNAAVSSTVASGIACSVDAVTHLGATTATGTASGTVS